MHRSTATERSPPPIAADLQLKLSKVTSQQQQLKLAFNQLNSQIRTGLLEAEDVFASLAIPLTKLVGLKTVEMADEGRFSSIVIDNKNSNCYHPKYNGWQRNGNNSEKASGRLALAIRGTDANQRISKFKEQNVAAKATKACKELMHKQKLQLMQLVQLLKQIEAQVNSSQDDIFQTLADNRASIQKLFQHAVTYVYAIHQSCQSNGISINMLKLLKLTFDHVASALDSVEIGVENLMTKLGDKMCNPMVEYVNELKAEMHAGTCSSLLAMVEEMGGEMRLRSQDLEEAGKKVKAAEESRIDALSKLKESEERIKTLKEEQCFLSEVKNGSRGQSVREKVSLCQSLFLGPNSFELSTYITISDNDGTLLKNVVKYLLHHSRLLAKELKKSVKFLCAEEDQNKEEKLLWELLRKKRKLQVPDSPCGAKHVGIRTNEKNLRSTRIIPPIRCRSTKMSQLAGLSPETPSIDFWIPLGSSPSTVTHQVLSRTRITP